MLQAGDRFGGNADFDLAIADLPQGFQGVHYIFRSEVQDAEELDADFHLDHLKEIARMRGHV